MRRVASASAPALRLRTACTGRCGRCRLRRRVVRSKLADVFPRAADGSCRGGIATGDSDRRRAGAARAPKRIVSCCERALMNAVRVLIADDHQIVRIGLRSLLKTVDKVELIGEAADGRAAVDMTQELKPDVVLTDILMPGMTGIEAVRAIKRSQPEVRVIMLTSLEDKFYLTQAMNAGADGYLSKEVGRQELTAAIEGVMRFEKVFSNAILALMSNPDLPMGESGVHDPNTNVYLSRREQEILTFIAEGKTSKEIADILFISSRTVDTHRTNLMQKLQVKNSAGLVRFALLNGLFHE